MDCGNHKAGGKHRPRAWRLAGLGLIMLFLAMSAWNTDALAARSRSHRKTTTPRTSPSSKTTHVTRNPLALLKASVEHKAQKGRVYSRDVFDQSAEGGTITAWIYQGRVQKLSLHLFGDRGHYRNTYYLQGKWVFCVVKERWVYSHPISANTSRTLKMAKIKHEEYYLATGLGLYRPSPKSKLTKLTLSRRKAAERLLVQECAEASRIFKTHKSSTSSKKSVSSKHPTSRKKPITGKKSTSSKKTASKQR